MTDESGEPTSGLPTQELLAAAAGRLSARVLTPESGRSPDVAREIEACLEELRDRLTEALAGGGSEPLRDWAASDPLVPPLARALGHELARVPRSDPASAVQALEALRLLAQLEGDPLQPAASDAGDTDDLEIAMRSADAFELLVEVAHDFRSPLTSILFLAEALRDGHSGPLNDIQRSQLGLIYSAAFGLASIASDVMDLARQKRNLTDDEAEPFAVFELFSRVERMVRPIVEEKGLELKVTVPERVQSRGQPNALTRVLLNLTTNALKFTEKGTVELGVRPLPHGLLEYYVQDTGRGISPEQQETLFRPFRRRGVQPGEGHYFSGSGIGLSIARRLLRGMGSDLSLDSSDETGTRFSFVLPASPRGARDVSGP